MQTNSKKSKRYHGAVSDEQPAPSAIALLEAEGELVVEQGQFTLDGTAARAKLADFRLADGHGWVLLVVEAANLLDATRVQFDISNAVTRAAIIGAELERDELERIFDTVFADRGDPRIQARRCLAIACDAAASLEDRSVKLRSKRLGLTFDGNVEREPDQEEIVLPGGRIELEVRDTGFGARLTTVGPLHERGLLTTQACFSPIPVDLGEARISEGFTLATGIGPRSFGEAEGPGRGLIAWDGLGERSGIHLVANGVMIERLPGTNWKPNVVALVDASAAKRDLSQSRFIRDTDFSTLVSTAQAAHDAYEISALDQPRVRGDLPKAETPLVRMLPGIYVTFIVSVVLMIIASWNPGSFLNALMPVWAIAMFGSVGLGVVTFHQLPRAPAPTQLGPPALARIEYGPIVLDELGPVTKVRFDVRVFSTTRLPFQAKLETHIRTDQFNDYERDEWLWVHLPAEGYTGLFFDIELSLDRPRGALGRRKSRKALTAGSTD